MKKKIVCLLLAVALFLLTGCQDNQKKAPQLLEPVGIKMDTATVTRGEIYNLTVHHGEVVPFLEEVSFPVDGILGEVTVHIGDQVKKGQVLATLNHSRVQEQVDSLQAEIERIVSSGESNDSVAWKTIAIEEEKLAILRESNGDPAECIAQELKIEQLKLDLEQAQELRQLELDYKRSNLSALEEQKKHTAITAPVNGEVVYVTSAVSGNTVKAHTTVVGIADGSRLTVETAYLPESIVGQADKITARIQDKEYPAEHLPYGQEEYMAMILSGQEAKTRYTLTGDLSEVHSGQYAAVLAIDSYKENVLTLPANAVYSDDKGYYVYKVQEETRVRCDISVGVITDTKVEIEAGVQEGDAVYVKE